jgi:translin
MEGRWGLVSLIEEIGRIEKDILGLEERRDAVMALSRMIIRSAGKMITAVHAGNNAACLKEASFLGEAIKRMRKMEKGLEFYSLQAHQEYVEAFSFMIMVREMRIPRMAELGEGSVSYLLGLMDTVGELKREIFDRLRNGDRDSALVYFGIMEEIYDSSLPLRFPNSIMPDFRKKQDVARIQIEGLMPEILAAEKEKKQ